MCRGFLGSKQMCFQMSRNYPTSLPLFHLAYAPPQVPLPDFLFRFPQIQSGSAVRSQEDPGRLAEPTDGFSCILS